MYPENPLLLITNRPKSNRLHKRRNCVFSGSFLPTESEYFCTKFTGHRTLCPVTYLFTYLFSIPFYSDRCGLGKRPACEKYIFMYKNTNNKKWKIKSTIPFLPRSLSLFLTHTHIHSFSLFPHLSYARKIRPELLVEPYDHDDRKDAACASRFSIGVRYSVC